MLVLVLSAILLERLIVMAIDRNDILGYLCVLRIPEFWDRLTADEQKLGYANLMGCYSRLMSALEKARVTDNVANILYKSIHLREHFNARMMLPVGHPELVAASEEASAMLFSYLRGNYLTSTIKAQFLSELDGEFARILNKV